MLLDKVLSCLNPAELTLQCPTNTASKYPGSPETWHQLTFWLLSPITDPLTGDTHRKHTTCQLPNTPLCFQVLSLMPFLKNPRPDFDLEHNRHFLLCLLEFPPLPPHRLHSQKPCPKAAESCPSCSRLRCHNWHGCCCLWKLDGDDATLTTSTTLVAKELAAYGSPSLGKSRQRHVIGRT